MSVDDDDLLSMLAGMESAISQAIPRPGVAPENAAPAPATRERSTPESLMTRDVEAIESGRSLRPDPFRAELTRHPDEAPPWQGVPASRGTTAAVLAAFAFAGES
ncbi:MAG: hypothetical protein AAGH15_16360 [Myxococcota bacterium]